MRRRTAVSWAPVSCASSIRYGSRSCKISHIKIQEHHHPIRTFGRGILGDDVDTLDDGEAATIAYAVEKQGVAIIDERKAKRICRARFTQLHVASTIDLIGLDVVASALGPRLHAESVFKALMDGRMRVLPEHLDWVVGLIGTERAAQCLSLPAHARVAKSFG